MKQETLMTLDFDKAVEVIDRLRFIKDEDEWHDQIEGITRTAVSTALAAVAIPMRASGTSVTDAWHMIPDTEKDPDGFLVITNQHLIGP